MTQPPAKAKDPMQALLDDLEQSIAGFDQRLHDFQADPTATGMRSSQSVFPTIDAEAKWAPAVTAAKPNAASAAPSTPAVQPEAAPVDLLAELAKAAASQSASAEDQRRQAEAVTEELHAGLKNIFDYLIQLVHHANVAKPALPRPFRLDARNSFGNLAWLEGSVDYRSTNRFDRSYYSRVLFSTRYGSPTPLTAVTPASYAESLRRELQHLNLKVENEAPTMLPEGGPGVQFTLPNAIPMQISFDADFEANRILLRCRNLEGFGLAAFTLKPGDINRTLLDGIGLCLLGRTQGMPTSLQRVPFRRHDN